MYIVVTAILFGTLGMASGVVLDRLFFNKWF